LCDQLEMDLDMSDAFEKAEHQFKTSDLSDGLRNLVSKMV